MLLWTTTSPAAGQLGLFFCTPRHAKVAKEHLTGLFAADSDGPSI